MGNVLWVFEGFVTSSGNRLVQDWYWQELTIDDRDYIRDRISKLENLERINWRRPGFDKLDSGLCEIQKTTPSGEMRIYGYFPPERHHFVLLHGHYKKVNNDKKGKGIALKRLKTLKAKIGGTHEFNFQEESN